MSYNVDKPSTGWQTDFTINEKRNLRPIAETLAMLDGNAFFGNPVNRNEIEVEWYEMYLPEAAALYYANGGDNGWAGMASFIKENKTNGSK